jgi:hypothetical protein
MRLRDEIPYSVSDAALDEIVPEDDANPFSVGKVFRKVECGGDASLAFLVGAVEMVESKPFSIRQQTQKIAGALSALHQQYVSDPGFQQRLNRIVGHRLVVDR